MQQFAPEMPETIRHSSGVPLFVDLDGTLIATDLLHEAAFLMVKRYPLETLRLPVWIVTGKAQLKHELSERVVPDAATLPYRAEVIEFLQRERETGRRVVLATASPRRWAQAVADHLGLFDSILASSASQNLSGLQKLSAIKEDCKSEFAYIGDSAADLPIWEQAAEKVAVNYGQRAIRSAHVASADLKLINVQSWRVGAIVRVIRPYQWSKNLLVLAPLAFAHELGNPEKLLAALFAFVSFSACASGAYVLNDLLDIDSDRKHPRKCKRPFAAGTLTPALGMVVGMVLFAIAMFLAVYVGWSFFVLLLLYAVMTTSYSLYFKRKLLLDVMCLSALYTLRLIAGGEAAAVVLTPWLLAFSMFLFTSLAFAKRYAELTMTEPANGKPSGRGYTVEDLSLIESVGPTTGLMAALVFALYINSDTVQKLYAHPRYLWLICPLLMYWILRLWFVAKRRKLEDDPIVYAFTDHVSLITGGLVLLMVVLATLNK